MFTATTRETLSLLSERFRAEHYDGRYWSPVAPS